MSDEPGFLRTLRSRVIRRKNRWFGSFSHVGVLIGPTFEGFAVQRGVFLVLFDFTQFKAD